jgi:hypothetical protein
LNHKNDIEFNFFDEIKNQNIYKQLFPRRKIGLAIILLYEKVIAGSFTDKQFTEKDIHNAFVEVSKPLVRHQIEDYSGYIYELQEYFLDYDQESQKYVFKDYAYKFCKHAKSTLKGALSPTKIKKLCNSIIKLLKDINDDDVSELQDWLEIHYKDFEPKLREQIDFLEKQIANSVEQLKKDASFNEQKFIDVLKGVEDSLDNAREQSKELRSAYEQTKTIRTLLEKRKIEDDYVNDLIIEVNSFIGYVNLRLNTIDKKLQRIQPRIRQLFSTLNRPRFNSKVQKFIRYVLNNSEVKIIDNKKIIVFPETLSIPKIHFATPNFTMLRKDIELFPSRPRKVINYKQNESLITLNKEKVLNKINQQKKVSDWEKYIMSEIELRNYVNLSGIFYKILNEENDVQVATTSLFNVVKKVRKRGDLSLHIVNELEKNNNFKNISLWKMEVTKSL